MRRASAAGVGRRARELERPSGAGRSGARGAGAGDALGRHRWLLGGLGLGRLRCLGRLFLGYPDVLGGTLAVAGLGGGSLLRDGLAGLQGEASLFSTNCGLAASGKR
jgi:hypothetical protein